MTKAKTKRKAKTLAAREDDAIARYEKITANYHRGQFEAEKCKECGAVKPIVHVEDNDCVYCGDPHCDNPNPHGDSHALSRDDAPDFPFDRFCARPLQARTPAPRPGYEQRWKRAPFVDDASGFQPRNFGDWSGNPCPEGVMYVGDVVLCERALPVKSIVERLVIKASWIEKLKPAIMRAWRRLYDPSQDWPAPNMYWPRWIRDYDNDWGDYRWQWWKIAAVGLAVAVAGLATTLTLVLAHVRLLR